LREQFDFLGTGLLMCLNSEDIAYADLLGHRLGITISVGRCGGGGALKRQQAPLHASKDCSGRCTDEISMGMKT
jgi:hypothetical protein